MSSLPPVRGGFARSVLVALMLLGVVGHICVLPSAGEIMAAGAGETHHRGDDDGSAASHRACRDATVSRAVASASSAPAQLELVSAAPRVERALAAPREPLAHPGRMPGSDAGPPLFILHASLLI